MRALRRALLGDMPLVLAGVLLLVLLSMAVSTRQYVAVWRSEVTLWQHAVRLAPQKPRTLNNYGVAVAATGQLTQARVWFERAHQAGHSVQLPPWDRVEGERASRANLKAVDDLLRQMP